MEISRGDLIHFKTDSEFDWARCTGRENDDILQAQLGSGKYIAVEREKIIKVIPYGKILYRPPDEDD